MNHLSIYDALLPLTEVARLQKWPLELYWGRVAGVLGFLRVAKPDLSQSQMNYNGPLNAPFPPDHRKAFIDALERAAHELDVLQRARQAWDDRAATAGEVPTLFAPAPCTNRGGAR